MVYKIRAAGCISTTAALTKNESDLAMTETVLPEKMKRRQAQELGLKKYFTGKPCKNGHLSERYIGGVCISCVDERNNTNKDKFNECRMIKKICKSYVPPAILRRTRSTP